MSHFKFAKDAKRIDRTVGLWLRDIPYFFVKFKKDGSDDDWTSFGRIYLFPTLIGRETSHTIRVQNGLEIFYTPFREDNKSCEQYFCFITRMNLDYERNWKKRLEPIIIWINGRKRYLPYKILIRCIVSKKCYEIYDTFDLLIPKPILENGKIRGDLILDQFEEGKRIQAFIPRLDRKITESPWENLTISNKRKRNLAVYLSLCGFENICIPKSGDVYQEITFAKVYGVLVAGYYDTNSQILMTESQITPEYLRDITTCIAMRKNICILLKVSGVENSKVLVHSILMIINNQNKNVYIMDPHGISSIFPSWYKNIDTILTELRIPKISFGWKQYYMSHEVCPSFSFQNLEQHKISSGFCLVWTIYTIHLINNNPDIEYFDLIREGINKVSKVDPDFTNFIQAYSAHLMDKVLKEVPNDALDDPNLYAYVHKCHIGKIDMDKGPAKQISFENFEIIEGTDKSVFSENEPRYYEYYLKPGKVLREEQILALCTLNDVVLGMNDTCGFFCYRYFANFTRVSDYHKLHKDRIFKFN
jgi:hypothetical protein